MPPYSDDLRKRILWDLHLRATYPALVLNKEGRVAITTSRIVRQSGSGNAQRESGDNR